MKMAKACEADLNIAMELCSALNVLGQRFLPCMPEAIEQLQADDEREDFDRDDDAQCGRALRHLLDIAERGSLMRVVWGCAVMLDPRNQCVDPDADTIEHHPDTVRWRKLRDVPATALPPGPMRVWLLARPGGADTMDRLADSISTSPEGKVS